MEGCLGCSINAARLVRGMVRCELQAHGFILSRRMHEKVAVVLQILHLKWHGGYGQTQIDATLDLFVDNRHIAGRKDRFR